ncbi:MAG TPA: Ig-like domain-containing protein [Candidatus Binataceae bacterium]|nr:Ig-like domain-containing protein [Candidatus Binataceae bacterium]
MSHVSRLKWRVLIGLALGALLALSGCGGGGGGSASASTPSNPDETPILALSASPTSVVISASTPGSTVLHAELLNPGDRLPVGGISVSFSASGGSLAAATVTSDVNGSANNTLFVPAAATGSSIQVTAQAHGASRSLTISVVSLASIELAALPSSLQCTNGSPGLSVIQATALDASNNPLQNVTIDFSESGAATLNSSTAVTAVNGQATVTATTPLGVADGQAMFTAQAAGASASITVPITGCFNQGGGTPTPIIGGNVLQFVSATPTQIGVLQSGQPTQSAIIFKLTDPNGNPVVGATVDFFITSIGGEAVSPTAVVTADDGTVQTELTAGTRATVVQVTAEAGSAIAISTAVSIVGGPPVQGRISAGVQYLNVAGNVTQGLQDPITVLMSDQFSNPVPPGTAVSLQSVGGAVSVLTTSDNNGVATGMLLAEAPTNPTDLNGVPTNGIVTILAYTFGQTPFIDLHGTGVYEPGDPVIPVPEPFFDLNGDGVRESNEPFIDLNGSGQYSLDQSNGQFSQHVVVFTSTRVTFSGATVASLSPPSGFTIPFGNSQVFMLTLADGFGNPLVSGSTFEVVSAPGGTVAGATGTVPDGQSFGQLIQGLNQFPITVTDSNQAENPTPITLTITVTSPPSSTTPGGNGSTTIQVNGTMD